MNSDLFFYRSAHTETLNAGITWPNLLEQQRANHYSNCPYCKAILVNLAPQVIDLGAECSSSVPTFCTKCGWWYFTSQFDDPSHAYEWHTRTVAELIAYEISGLETPAKLLIEYLAEHYRDVQRISPRKFEEVVYTIFQDHIRCEVALTKSTRDGGKDLVCFDADHGKFIVEIKRHKAANKVGIAIVQRFAGVMVNEGVESGIIVTSSNFTKGAQRAASEILLNSKDIISLDLKDRRDLLSWLTALAEQYRTMRADEIVGSFHNLPHRCEVPASLIQAIKMSLST